MIYTESLVTNTIDSIKVRYCEASTLYKVYKEIHFILLY